VTNTDIRKGAMAEELNSASIRIKPPFGGGFVLRVFNSPGTRKGTSGLLR